MNQKAAKQSSSLCSLPSVTELWGDSAFEEFVNRVAGAVYRKAKVELFGLFSVKLNKDGSQAEIEKIDVQTHKKMRRPEEDVLEQVRQEILNGAVLLSASDGKPFVKNLEESSWVVVLSCPYNITEGHHQIICWVQGEDPSTDHHALFLGVVQRELFWFNRLSEAESLLYEDELTGLYNYRYLDIVLDNEIKRAQRFRNSFCLYFIDLDNFKQVNDRFGHLVGSRILKDFGRELSGQLRDVDCVIRYGGDEYVVILLGTDATAGEKVAERIRHHTEKFSFQSDCGKEIKLTLSIGIAAFPEHSQNKTELIRMADDAMYASKNSGKNKVIVSDGKENSG